MSESLPSGYVIFCDDVRQEIGNKLSFIGVYTGDLLLHAPSFPVALPKFCVFVTYIQDIAARRNSKLEIFLPGDPPEKPTAVGEVPMGDLEPSGKTSTGENATKLIARLVIAFGPAMFNQPGKLKVVMKYDDGTTFEMGALNVLQAPPAEANKPA